MSAAIFIEESRLGRKILEIRDGFLFVSFRRVGRKTEAKLDLRTLDSNYGTVAVRNHAAILLFLVAMAACSGVISGLWHETLIPDAVELLATYLLAFLGILLFGALRWVPRVEFYAFSNLRGRRVLMIAREKAQATACDDFVRTLIASIEEAQSGGRPSLSPVRVTPSEAGIPKSETRSPGFRRWKTSIAFGLIACVVRFAPGSAAVLEDLLNPLVFIFCMTASIFCVLSFADGEPSRWWSLIGLLLALVGAFAS